MLPEGMEMTVYYKSDSSVHQENGKVLCLYRISVQIKYFQCYNLKQYRKLKNIQPAMALKRRHSLHCNYCYILRLQPIIHHAVRIDTVLGKMREKGNGCPNDLLH